MNRLLLLVFFIITFNKVFPQCENVEYFDNWRREGDPSAEWTRLNDSTVVQSNEPFTVVPTFFVSNNSFVNVEFEVDMKVDSYFDNDFIGLVFGYQQPENSTQINDYDFYLFDWKRAEETFQSHYAAEGFTLSRVQGKIENDLRFQYFWRHNGYSSDGTMEILATNHDDNNGWEPGRTYHAALRYTTSGIMICVDGDTIFNVTGCFAPGRFGFYGFSQPRVMFSNCRYRLATSFTLEDRRLCLGEEANAFLVDPECPSYPENIDHWIWDFGDGFTSTELNPSHPYEIPGNYTIQLVAYDIAGCSDSVARDIRVYPVPEISLGPDTLIPYNGTIIIDGGFHEDATYKWTTGESASAITLSGLQQDTLIGVVITMHGCEASDEKMVRVLQKPEEPEFRCFLPNAFSPNGDLRNDYFRPQFSGGTVKAFQMLIFDRWGKQVGISHDYHRGWDGRCGPSPCKGGTYTYLIRYEAEDAATVPVKEALKGIVYLIR